MQLAVGDIAQGKVAKITNYGAFIDFEDGSTGMIHISEVANTYVKDINDHIKLGDTVSVKVIGINEQNKVSLSIKAM
ncbi:MAG: S1 RNA-binding domain-containing protein, partial [Angelakisella sp.]